VFEQWRKIVNRLEEFEQSYGLWPSPPDLRDYQFKVFAGTLALPQAFSRKSEMPPVRDQGKLGTCVGHAACAIKEWQERQQGDNPEGGLSPRFIYALAKQQDGIPSQAGTYPRVALKVVQEYGDCPERVFPYGELTSDVNLSPPPADVVVAAKPYKISTYARLNNLGEVKRAIVEQGPVLLGITVCENFMQAKDYIPEPEGYVYGGHAIVACAYDDNIKLGPYTGGVLLQNSWGTSWAQNGYCWLPYEAWNWMIDRDIGWPFIMEAWTCVDVPFTPKMARQILLKLNNPTAFVDGEYVQLDVPPTVIGSRTLLPIRFVAERMGYLVSWHPENSLVELRRPY